jgi:hypothetical protein
MARIITKTSETPYRRMHWPLFGLGLIPLALGLYGLSLGLETRSWPGVDATVVDGTFRVGKSESNRHDRKASETASYRVRFRYTVGGVEYIADGLERGALGMQNSAAAREHARQYRPGTTGTAWYNPADPSEAYLVRGVSSPAKMLTGIGAFIWLCGFMVRRIVRSDAYLKSQRDGMADEAVREKAAALASAGGRGGQG